LVTFSQKEKKEGYKSPAQCRETPVRKVQSAGKLQRRKKTARKVQPVGKTSVQKVWSEEKISQKGPARKKKSSQKNPVSGQSFGQ
jgi:hypothetical protein